MKKETPRRYFIRIVILVFILTFVLSFFLSFSALYCIENFFKINRVVFYSIISGISLLLAVINSLIILRLRHDSLRHAHSLLFLKRHTPKILLSYFILLFFLVSIKNAVTWTASEEKEVLTIEWTIFGLALTIFLVWNIVIIQYYKKKSPSCAETERVFDKLDQIIDKQLFSLEIEASFLSVALLSVNLFLLLFSTSLVYISRIQENIFTQNVIRGTFFFSTNSIGMLFLDMIKPIKKEKNLLLKENQTSKEEIDLAIVDVVAQESADRVIRSLDGVLDLSEDEIKAIYKRYNEIETKKLSNQSNTASE